MMYDHEKSDPAMAAPTNAAKREESPNPEPSTQDPQRTIGPLGSTSKIAYALAPEGRGRYWQCGDASSSHWSAAPL